VQKYRTTGQDEHASLRHFRAGGEQISSGRQSVSVVRRGRDTPSSQAEPDVVIVRALPHADRVEPDVGILPTFESHLETDAIWQAVQMSLTIPLDRCLVENILRS